MWKWTFAFAVFLLVHGTGTKGDHVAVRENGNCECLPYYLCPNGASSDRVDAVPLIGRKCEKNYEVCCRHLTTAGLGTPPPPAGCGHRNPDGVGFRITGAEDHEAEFGEFPWMVAVMTVGAVDPKEREEAFSQKAATYQCGGSLIHPKVVLTGAHCVAGKESHQIKIRAGEWDMQTDNELYSFQERDVKQIVVHENFMGGNLFNDVALLFLTREVALEEHIGFACLPAQGYTPSPGTTCIVTGWGNEDFGKESHRPSTRRSLKKIDLPVVANPECQAALRNTILGRHFKLHQSFMCAGGQQDKDACKGDGGSPLVCPLPHNPRIYVQSGIVAWGIECGKNEVPGVYANVALFRNWIDDQMHRARLDTSHYNQ